MAASSAKIYCEYCDIQLTSLFESLRHEGNMDHCLKKFLFTKEKEKEKENEKENEKCVNACSRCSSPGSGTASGRTDANCSQDDSLTHNFATYDGDNVFTCKICDTFVTGYIPFQQHVLGSKHQKKLKNMNEAAKLREMTDTFKGLEISEITDDDMQLVSCNSPGNAKLAPKNESPSTDVTFPFACESCDMKFTGEEPFMQHIDSPRHLKKVQKLAMHIERPVAVPVSPQINSHSTTPGPKSDDISMNGTDFNFPYVCLPCTKRFTGEEPYRQHLESAVHAKKVTMAATGPNERIFACCDCQLTFSGPIPLKQHLESPKHEKQMRKIELYGKSSCRMASGSPNTGAITSVYDGQNSKLDRELQLWQHMSATNRNGAGAGAYRPGDIQCIGVDEPVTLT